jgi:hypothetical protein
MKILVLSKIILLAGLAASAQSEVLTNAKIIDMTRAGLSSEVILVKIKTSVDRFDTSSDALIEMKKSGVADDVIAAVINVGRHGSGRDLATSRAAANEIVNGSPSDDSAKTSLATARTIAIQKSSLNPSLPALEKELLKRADWRSLHLTIEQYKENADLYIDIGFVPLSLVTHRYVFRIYDRRTGAVIAGGETTSWGSLPEHLAKHICESLNKIKNGGSGD